MKKLKDGLLKDNQIVHNSKGTYTRHSARFK